MPSLFRPAAVTAALAGVALAAAGCGAGGHTVAAPAAASSSAAAPAATASGTAVLRIVGNDRLRFEPMTVHVPVGRVRITLVDSGAYPHNIQVPSLGFTSPSVTGTPGELTRTFTIDFPHAGRYPFRCQFHYSAGMVGTFIAS